MPETSTPNRASDTPGSDASVLGRVARVLKIVLALLSVVLVVLFAVTSLRRLGYPFPLEQLEGSMALAVARVAKGLPLYGAPSFSFIPYMYSPAYFYVAAWAARLLGPGFLALRLVSFLSTLGCFAVIYALVFTETKDRLAALAGTGLYAAAYPVCQHWFDLGRVDSLYVLLVLLALLATRRLHPVFAALVWTLAFLAKQTIAPVALLTLCFDWKRPRRMLLGVGTFLLTSFGSTALLNHATHGWFRYYIFTVPRANSDLRLHATAFFPSVVLLAPFGIALVVIAAALLLMRVRWSNPTAHFYLLAGVSLTALCWFLDAHAGATANTAMPVYAFLAVAFGVALARLTHWLRGLPLAWSQAGLSLLLFAACAQLASQLYSPKLSIPSPALRASQQEFVHWLQSFPGDVFVVAHPYDAVLAGKAVHPDDAALHDALRPGIPAVNRPLLYEIQHAVDTESLDAIVLDRTPQQEAAFAWLPADWQTHYPILGLVPAGELQNPFAPQPRYVLLPCRELENATRMDITILSSDSPTPSPEAHVR
ncbi:MAG TPA: hypothetical protein VHX63_12695 [Acidobacteriaceae bacterium]|nr:hypothetical protein [Acidobacteriaceae bacterium]